MELPVPGAASAKERKERLHGVLGTSAGADDSA
jgi:hypothetical protein